MNKDKRVKVKICGITNLEDALESIKAGSDALGFVFYKKSPRYISEDKALQIIRGLPKKIKKVGVFVSDREARIKRIADLLGLDILQFHGNETVEFCKRFKDYKVIKAIRIKNRITVRDIARYPVWGILFDRYETGSFGGTGKTFDWNLIKGLRLKDKVIFVSGGLNLGNVRMAIEKLKPDWVDVSSSLEKKPGRKDIPKLKRFIEIVKQTKL
ncbi:MAG: phosphoribosylanthranilate isomerase [Candidatus Omnitrophica bacterium]|nr:phosphoribosylanthranilate isomerase [Candidatus Omnitrophota bacterium]